MALLCGRSFGILTQRFNAATLGSNFTPCRELFRPHCTLAFGREQARTLAFFRFLTGCVEIIGAFCSLKATIRPRWRKRYYCRITFETDSLLLRLAALQRCYLNTVCYFKKMERPLKFSASHLSLQKASSTWTDSLVLLPHYPLRYSSQTRFSRSGSSSAMSRMRRKSLLRSWSN